MTADPTTLRQLAAEVEALPRSNFAMEVRIRRALFADSPETPPPAYTASVDAGLALLSEVLPGVTAEMTYYADGLGCVCELRMAAGPHGEDWPSGTARTLPLALVTAILRAVAVWEGA